MGDSGLNAEKEAYMEPERIREWLMGPVVAMATPFKEDYSLDLDALQENVRYMIDNGVRTGQGALLVAAAGGEHPTLSPDERKASMDAALEAAQARSPFSPASSTPTSG